MNVVKKILNIVLIILTAVSVLLSSLWIYFKTSGKDKIPSAVTSTYATTITDPQTGETLPFMEVNYYSNLSKNTNGREVVELKFNCYSGISKQAIYARGFQLCNDKDGNIIQYEDPTTHAKSNVFEYNTYDSVSFETGHSYSWGDPMIVDIDGTTYAVKLDGQYQITTKKFSFLKAVGHTFAGLFTGYDYKTKAYNFETTTYNYTFEDLLLKVKQIVKSCSNGTGDSVISLIDLGDFLHIYAVDENGQISASPLGVNTLINSYFTMATHFDKRGMVWAKQSIFDSVAGDSLWNESGLIDNVEYWKSSSQVLLTEQDFNSRYSSVDNGFYFLLSTEKINELKTFKNIEIVINFNVSNLNVNVLGFDYYALYGIKVENLTIRSNTQRDFRLMVCSLKDTGLTEITTTNINLINNNSGVTL